MDKNCKTTVFQGGTIYNDAASVLIWVKNQVSLCANKNVMGKAQSYELYHCTQHMCAKNKFWQLRWQTQLLVLHVSAIFHSVSNIDDRDAMVDVKYGHIS
jgi:hypothetical protein